MKNFIFILLTFMLHACCPAAMAALTTVDKQDIVGKNLLVNGGFESGKARWTASGGSFATTTTSPMIGLVHATWDASASAQTLTSTAVAIPVGFRGRDGVVSCLITTPSGSATHSLQAYDGSAIVGTGSITSSTTPTRTNINFIFPSSGSISLRLYANADEPSISIDDCYVDLAENRNVSNVSQASIYGSASWSSCSADFSRVTASFGDSTSTPTGCTYTVTGSVTQPTTNVPGVRLQNLPPGDYEFTFIGQIYKGGSAVYTPLWRFSDGTNTTTSVTCTSGAASSVFCPGFSGRITYTTPQSDITVKIQMQGDGSNAAVVGGSGPMILVKRFPLSSQQAVNTTVQNWRVDANISGANPDLGTSDQASYVGITNSGLTLTNNSGSGVLTAQIPCSSTNSPTGTTCSVGDESVGVSFTIPRAGDVLACVSFAHSISNGASGSVIGAFQIVETPNNAQTISQEGRSRVGSTGPNASSNTTLPHRLCGTFTFASAGQKTLRLFYEQDVTATVNTNVLLADASSSVGQRDIHWEVYPIDQQFPAPVLVGSVTSQSTGSERIERATFTCSSSSALTRQSGSWLSSIGNVASGACALTIASGIFSASPSCVITADQNSSAAGVVWSALVNSATSVTVGCRVDTDGTFANCTANAAHIHCMGPR